MTSSLTSPHFEQVRVKRPSSVQVAATVLSEYSCSQAPQENKSETDASVKIKLLSDSVFSKITEEKSPEGVICVAKHIDKFHKIVKINNEDGFGEIDDLSGKSVFILESI